LIAAFVLFIGQSGLPVQAIFALPLLLFVPGYALTLALFRHKSLTAAERLLFSVGLSISLAALGGLVLNYTPWGLQAGSWLAWIVGVSLAAGVAAFLVQQEPLLVTTRRSVSTPPARDLTLFGAAAAFAVIALLLASQPAPVEGNVGYTSLWMIPDQTGHPTAVQVGIASSELNSTTYNLRLELNGQPLNEWEDITLQPGEKWSDRATLPPTKGSEKVEAFLYRTSNPGKLYRYALTQSQQEGN
jgi:uncharacterized membrane protein